MNFLQKWPVKMFTSWTDYLLHEPQKLKYYNAWFKTLWNGRSPLKDEIPWVNFETIEWFDRILLPDMKVFEWGSGGSTLFFSNRVQSLLSVEHEQKWYEIVVDVLSQKNITNVELILIEPERIHSSANTDEFISFSIDYPGYSFKNYVEIIAKYPNNSFDLIVVDGRARNSCLNLARDKVKPGGYLLLDNADRSFYQHAVSLVANWQKFEFTGPTPYSKVICTTAIWQKPR